jgi:hypothetical protein
MEATAQEETQEGVAAPTDDFEPHIVAFCCTF